MAKLNWQTYFKGLEVFQEPRRIAEQFEVYVGEDGPIPITIYEEMDKQFTAVPGWQRYVVEGTGMAGDERLVSVSGSGGSVGAALESLLSRMPAIKGARWKPGSRS